MTCTVYTALIIVKKLFIFANETKLGQDLQFLIINLSFLQIRLRTINQRLRLKEASRKVVNCKLLSMETLMRHSTLYDIDEQYMLPMHIIYLLIFLTL